MINANGTVIPLSIASSPLSLPKLRMIYKSDPNNPESILLDQHVRERKFNVSAATGKVCCPDDLRELILIAKGTGISQALAIAEHKAMTRSNKRIKLLWITSSAPTEITQETSRKLLSDLSLCLFTQAEYDAWFQENHGSLTNTNCVLTGDPEFVYSTMDRISKYKIESINVQSDVFEYVPRDIR